MSIVSLSKCRGLLGLGFIWVFAAGATNVFVIPPDHPAAAPFPPYTNWATAATNIQEAHDAIDTNGGNIVFITNGLYLLTNQVLVTKGVVLRSWNGGATDPVGTILDGNNAGKPVSNRVMLVNNVLAVVDGLTLQNGNVNYGGGMYIDKSLLITNCIIKNNAGGPYGGGIFVASRLGKMTHCQIISNTAALGGGLFISKGTDGIIEYCTVASNYASDGNLYNGGGGIMLVGDSATLVQNAVTTRYCTIAYNTAYSLGGGVQINFNGGLIENCLIVSNYLSRVNSTRRGSGVSFYKGSATVRNSLIAGNSNAINNFAVYMEQGGRLENCTIVNNINGGLVGSTTLSGTGIVVNTIIYSNLVANVYYTNNIQFTNCCAPDALEGSGHITNYPVFVNPEGDLRLTMDSPCINKGLNQDWMWDARDMDGHRRILEGMADIGAYEFLRRGTIFSLR